MMTAKSSGCVNMRVKFHPDVNDMLHVRQTIEHERRFQASKRKCLREERMYQNRYNQRKKRSV